MKKRNILVKKLGVTILLGAMGLSVLTGCSRHRGMNGSGTTGGNFIKGEAMGAAGDSFYGDEWYDEAMYDTVQSTSVESAMDVSGNVGSGSYNKVSPEEDGGTANVKDQSRKLIRTVDMELETEEFDVLIGEIEKQIAGLGGYIENAYTYNGSAFKNPSHGKNLKYANMSVRIPDDKLDVFVNGVSGISNVISKNTRAQDVTLQYVDTESKKKMYKAEEESLLALLEKAETVEDITYLTQRLTDVRYSIESMESTLRTYDNLVDYATINLNIQEVEVLTPTEVKQPKTAGEKIADGFVTNIKNIGQFFQNTGINFVINLPYFILILIIIGLNVLAIRIIIAIIKKAVKKNKAKKLQAASCVKAEAAEGKMAEDKKE